MMDELNELQIKLNSVIQARDNLNTTKNIQCTCSGFTIQYEGRCQCERGKQIRFFTEQLIKTLDSL